MSSRSRLVPILAAAALVGGAACTKSSDKGGGGDTSGLEARVKKLEADNAKYKDILELIYGQFQKQKQDQAAEEDNKHADDAVFAVDIKGNQIEGPASGAYVTIVEAWDFA